MVKNDNKKGVWLKVFKLFIEFIIAAATAFVTSLSGQAMNLW